MRARAGHESCSGRAVGKRAFVETRPAAGRTRSAIGYVRVSRALVQGDLPLHPAEHRPDAAVRLGDPVPGVAAVSCAERQARRLCRGPLVLALPGAPSRTLRRRLSTAARARSAPLGAGAAVIVRGLALAVQAR